MALPRRTDVPSLGESRRQAIQRFEANERSVFRKGNWTAFQEVVQEYMDLSHAEPVPQPTSGPQHKVYNLPMHGVTKASITSTKLRVMFNASAKTSSNVSLNDTLLVGPTLFSNIDTILLRFRTDPIALSGDISKMYRAVELVEKDRDLHRFVWRKDKHSPITDYRMTRVTWGSFIPLSGCPVPPANGTRLWERLPTRQGTCLIVILCRRYTGRSKHS